MWTNKMDDIPRTKREFEREPFMEQSKIMKKLVTSHFDGFCHGLTSACLPSFATVLHHSDLEELQKRARNDADSLIISHLLLKLFRSCKPWWKILESVVQDNNTLYGYLNPWDSQHDGQAAATGRSAQFLPHPPCSPPLSLQQQHLNYKGAPQPPFPTTTPLGDTWGLADMLRPLCEGQKWRALADKLGITNKEQRSIKASGGEIHIHLLDKVNEKSDDGATVGTLILALQQLGEEGESIINLMERKRLIQPVPREGSEAGEGVMLGFDNPYQSEREGGTSTLTASLPEPYPAPAQRNRPFPLGSQPISFPPMPLSSSAVGIDPVNLSNSSLNKMTVANVAKSFQVDQLRATSVASGINGYNPQGDTPSDSLTDNERQPLDGSSKELNMATSVYEPSGKADTAYSSLESQQLNQPTATSQMNILSEEAALHVDSPSESLGNVQHQNWSAPSDPGFAQEPPSNMPDTLAMSAASDEVRQRDGTNLQHSTTTNIFNITCKIGKTKTVQIGNRNTVASDSERPLLSDETVRQDGQSDSDEETIAEFDAQENENENPNAGACSMNCNPEYAPEPQQQYIQENCTGLADLHVRGVGENTCSLQPLPWDIRHQTACKQLWEVDNTLVEESESPSDNYLLSPPQECEEDLSLVNVQAVETKHNLVEDVDVQTELRQVETLSVSANSSPETHSTDTLLRGENQFHPEGDADDEQQLQQDRIFTRFFHAISDTFQYLE